MNEEDIVRPDLEEEELSTGQLIKRELSRVVIKSHNVLGFGHWTLYTLGHRQKHPELALAWLGLGIGLACVGMPVATLGALLQAWLELGSDPTSPKLDILRKKYDPEFEPLWVLGDEPPGYMAKLEGAIDVQAEALSEFEAKPLSPISENSRHQALPNHGQLPEQSQAQPYTPTIHTQLNAIPAVATPAPEPYRQAEAMDGGRVATTQITALYRLLQSPLASRAFIGAQRTGKSGLVAVAGRELSKQGYTFYHINLASYSQVDGQSEDDDYTKHIHPANSVRGDIATVRSKEEVHRLVDRATSLVHDWFATRNSILIVDEWFSLASQTIDYSDITYPLAQLIAGKLAHLTSAGTKRGLALWLITPQVKAGAMTEAGKEIKQCKLCYVGIAPNKSVQWKRDRITWDAELYSYVSKNFPIDHPSGPAIQGETRISYVNGEWLPLGTTESHFEEMARAPKAVREVKSKPEMYGSAELDEREESSVFEDFLNDPSVDNPKISTDRINAEIAKLRSSPKDRAQCLADLLEFIRESAVNEGKAELRRGEITTSNWAGKWKKKGSPFSDCSSPQFECFVKVVCKAGFLSTEDEKLYKLTVS